MYYYIQFRIILRNNICITDVYSTQYSHTCQKDFVWVKIHRCLRTTLIYINVYYIPQLTLQGAHILHTRNGFVTIIYN